MEDKETQSEDSTSEQEKKDLEIIAKYDLPSQEELTTELGSYDSESSGLIKTLINQLLSKSQKFSDFLEEMLHPDSNITSMQEASMFSNEDREKMFQLFRELTFFQRKALLMALCSKEEEKAAYFKEFYAFFLSKKSQIKTYVKQAISIWESKEMPTSVSQGYFG